ncbi:hypothetical protein L3Q65_00400 (plasmid) [Amycolatopsis sp. FU40]|uniref:hypothetical protein n=1 Tax=Amycolatopsis sp. FU40 TaxID=2914159 RepID=UPI001F37B280|nr:hypothetical protein [Amycolatopsis sp. FU40]UKD50789.1 hypothetical protein L3Q65_00400 [Amycolatopsis sp. FU40]
MSGDTAREAGGQGGDWTLWAAAHAWAHAMRGLVEMPDAEPGTWDVPEVLVAFALADYARAEGIAAVASPQDLADLSLTALYGRADPMGLLVALSTASPSGPAAPSEGEPGQALFSRLKSEIDAFNAGGVQAVVADPQRMARAKATGDEWIRRCKDAQLLVARTIMASAREAADLDAGGGARLRLLADRVPGHVKLNTEALLRADRPAPAAAAGSAEEFRRAQERAEEITVAAGHTEGWPAGAARRLLALLLLAAAGDRGETVAAVPWSAVRARTLLDEPARLLDYLDAALADLGAADAEHPAAGALRFVREHHFYPGWDSSDGLSSNPGPDPAPRLSYGWPVALEALDQQLLADRGGFGIGDEVSTTRTFDPGPVTGIVRGAAWEIAAPPGRPGLVDLAPGIPHAYVLDFHTPRIRGSHRFEDFGIPYDGPTERVLAGKCVRAARR